MCGLPRKVIKRRKVVFILSNKLPTVQEVQPLGTSLHSLYIFRISLKGYKERKSSICYREKFNRPLTVLSLLENHFVFYKCLLLVSIISQYLS